MSGSDEEKLKALKVIIEGAFWFELNMNDTFAFACADSEEMCPLDFEKIIPVIAEYGHDALTAYAAFKRDAEPEGPSLNDNYKKARVLIAEALK